MFTDAEDGRYFAPFAYLGNKPSAQALADMTRVLERDELPEHIPMHDIQTIAALRKQQSPYAAKGLQEITRALRESKGVDSASQLMEQHFRITPHQAIDLFDTVMNRKGDRQMIEDLANSTLMRAAGSDPSETMTTQEKARIMQKQFVERLRNRC